MPNGATTFVPTTTCHKLFVLKTFFTVDKHTKKVFISSTKTNPLYNFVKYITTLIDLPKNKPVCLLEQNPLKGIKYSRSSGSYSKILKMDSRTGLGIVKLTSGFTKIFSIHGLGSEG
jgi:ribosomal protein L2